MVYQYQLPSSRSLWRTTVTIFFFILILLFCVSNILFFRVITQDQEAKKGQTPNIFFPHSGSFFDNTNDTMINKGIEAKSIRSTDIRLIGSSYFACNAPKTGCTAWKSFYLYVNEGILLTANMTKDNPGVVHIQRKKNSTINEVWTKKMSHLTDKEITNLFTNFDRIVVARNPYVRFLSSYQDWLFRVGKAESDVPFSNFTELYESRNFKGFHGFTYDHIDPVTTYCKFEQLGGYITLRVEEQALWFNEFVDHYNLTQKMKEYVKGGNLVFESLLDESSRVADLVPSIVGTQSYPSILFKSIHHRESSNKLVQYYTPELAAKVTQLFMSDFIHFQYPLWDGNPVTFHFV